MEEFLKIEGLVDVLSIIGSLLSMIMFAYWLKEKKEATKRLFSAENFSYALMFCGAGFLLSGESGISVLFYTAWWVTTVYVFFSKKERSIIESKSSVFTLILNTCLLFFVIQVFVFSSVQDSISGIVRNQLKLVELHEQSWEFITSVSENSESLDQLQISILNRQREILESLSSGGQVGKTPNK